MVRGVRWAGVVTGLTVLACQGSAPETWEGARPLHVPIIGGERDTVSRGVVGILTQDSLCSGSLLAPNLVLTARHCVASTGTSDQIDCSSSVFSPTYDPGSLAVTTDNDLTANGITPLYDVSEIRVPSANRVCGNDVAVMLLAENIPASSATPLIPRLEDRPVADERFDAVGYGIQQADDDLGETAGVRMRANGNAVACVGAIACQGTDATNTEWVAEVPICSGDSGGPALDAQGRVIGVASRSNIDCSAGLYEAVDSWKDMIIEAAHDAAEQGGYEPPTWAASAPSSGGTAGTGSGGTAGTGSGGTAGTAGAGTAGTPSAGTGGSPTAGTGPGSSGGGNTAGRDPTGTSCTNSSCPNGYLCYAADEPPGICVPACSSLDTECPTGYACDVRVGACEPEEDDKPSRRRSQSDEGCGCRTAPASSRADHAWGILALAGIFAGTVRRRRRAPR